MYKNQKGFSLAELLIVVAIIAVLVSISVPIFQGKKKATINATNKANIRSARAYVVSCGLVDQLENKNCFEDNGADVFWYDIRDGRIKVLKSETFRKTGIWKPGVCANWDWIKENGVYRYILVMYYYDEGKLQVLTKPFVNDKGEVVFGCGSNGAEESFEWYNKDHEDVMNCHPEYNIDDYNPKVY